MGFLLLARVRCLFRAALGRRVLWGAFWAWVFGLNMVVYSFIVHCRVMPGLQGFFALTCLLVGPRAYYCRHVQCAGDLSQGACSGQLHRI